MNKLVCRCVYLLAGEISVHTVNGSDPLLSQDALHQKIHAFKILKCLIIMEQFLCHTNKQANKTRSLPFVFRPEQYQTISYPCLHPDYFAVCLSPNLLYNATV